MIHKPNRDWITPYRTVSTPVKQWRNSGRNVSGQLAVGKVKGGDLKGKTKIRRTTKTTHRNIIR